MPSVPGPCRLKATLQRLRRLTEGYSSELMGAYTARAVAMGKALGLDPDRYNGECANELPLLLVCRKSLFVASLHRPWGWTPTATTVSTRPAAGLSRS